MKIKQDVYQDIEFDIRTGMASIKQDKDDGTGEYDHIVIDKVGAENLIEQLFRFVTGE